MKTNSYRLSFPLLAGSSLFASGLAHAADGTWNANSAGIWSDTTKWTGGFVADGAAQTWTNNSTGALTTGSGTNLINNGGYQLTVDGSGTTNFGTVSLAPATLTGSGALV